MLLIFSTLVFPQNGRILLDENYSDWTDNDLLYTDTQGDYDTGEHDFLTLWANNDDHYLFIRFQIADEAIIAEDNAITLYIDTDNNQATGRNIFGVGSELEFSFGIRSGTVRLNGSFSTIRHADIELVVSPTVSSNQFEVAIKKNVLLLGQPLFTSQTIKLLLISNSTVGDRLPNVDGGVEYNFKNILLPPLPEYAIKKQNPSLLRILTYNTERIFQNNVQIDGIFDQDRIPRFEKIFKAIEPDIIGLVEIYGHTSQETATQISSFISPAPSSQWYNAKAGYDLVLLSKFPITGSYSISNFTDNMKNGAFLLNLRPKYESDLLVILAHPKCCSGNENETRRQAQVDAIMQFIREAKQPGGDLTINTNIPIIIMGDMNFVGSARQRQTILTGDIFENNYYGTDFNPDWDTTSFEDAKPYTTNLPMTFTSYNETGDYCPGRLDYIFYSGSVLELKNSYALFTMEMPNDTLVQYSLAYNDVSLVSDHLPIVADFNLPLVTGVDKKTGFVIPDNFILEQNFPNPFNPTTKIKFQIPEVNGRYTIPVRLSVYDSLGNFVINILDEEKPPGYYEIDFEGGSLSSGVYFYKLQSSNFFNVKKMILLK